MPPLLSLKFPLPSRTLVNKIDIKERRGVVFGEQTNRQGFGQRSDVECMSVS